MNDNLRGFDGFLDWERWDDGDFEGWQIPSVNNALIAWYNTNIVDGDKYKPIFTMESFKTNVEPDFIDYRGITQSVMSFSYDEVEKDMFSDFDYGYPFARIGYADFGDKNTDIPLRISMTRADCSNWIMTFFGGNNIKIATEIKNMMSEDDFNTMIKDIEDFLRDNVD